MSAGNGTDSWVVIQRNPLSGSGRGGRELLTLVSALRRRGYRVRMFSDRAQLDRWVVRAAGDRRICCIVAAGGDGTVADLVNRHPTIPLAVLPLGTENLLAKYLGLRRDGEFLSGVIAAGVVRRLDSAFCNGRRFLLMVSCGPDAEVVECVHSRRRGHISRWDYVGPVIRSLLSATLYRFEVTAAELSQPVSGVHVIVSSVPKYGFDFPFSPAAEPDDGLLDVRVYHGGGRAAMLWHVVRLRLGWPIAAAEVTSFRTTAVSVRVQASPGVAHFQFDGDPGGELPLSVVVAPSSMRLLVPAAAG